jgi:hypothetical protein
MLKTYICALVVMMGLISISVCLAEEVDEILKITDHTTAKYVQEGDPFDPIDRTVNFDNSNSKVYSWVKTEALKGKIYKGHTIKWVYTSPDGVIIREHTDDIGSSSSGYGWIKWNDFLDLESVDATNNTGIWHIDIYVDDKYYMSDGFNLQI